MLFEDRRDAGRQLAHKLAHLRGQPNTLLLALPRGGVPVAYEVARELNLPLDIFLVRKLGAPGHEELAMGALTGDGTCVFNHDVIHELNIPASAIDEAIERERLELQRREQQYRAGQPPRAIEGKTVVLIDDGLATGATMRAAVRALRPVASQVIIAVPVAAASTCDDLRSEGNQVLCIHTPEPFAAVGLFYQDFRQTTDDEVRTLLAQSCQPPHSN
ncbi:phosphoribosyltransferase [Edaphobacter bradus]|uniref:phosphoribosyltransferase n=1 Tax=Edaphobacter bradus TaxID=2259016 RepID=UPI0021E0127E|nr:phosphoribosyltransferase [Edaphobacter bradus]